VSPRLGRSGFVGKRNVGRDLAAQQARVEGALDERYVGALRAGREGRSRSTRSGASGAAHAVNEVAWSLRKIIVHHVRDAFDVNAAGGDVGGHQDAIVAFLEAAQRLVALVLAAVAVDGGGLHAFAGEGLR